MESLKDTPGVIEEVGEIVEVPTNTINPNSPRKVLGFLLNHFSVFLTFHSQKRVVCPNPAGGVENYEEPSAALIRETLEEIKGARGNVRYPLNGILQDYRVENGMLTSSPEALKFVKNAILFPKIPTKDSSLKYLTPLLPTRAFRVNGIEMFLTPYVGEVQRPLEIRADDSESIGEGEWVAQSRMVTQRIPYMHIKSNSFDKALVYLPKSIQTLCNDIFDGYNTIVSARRRIASEIYSQMEKGILPPALEETLTKGMDMNNSESKIRGVEEKVTEATSRYI